MQGADEQYSQNKGSETHSKSSKGSKAKPRRKQKPRTKNLLNLKQRIAEGTLYSSYKISGRSIELTKSEKYSNVDDSLILKTLSDLRRYNPDFLNYFKSDRRTKKNPNLIFNDSYQITEETNPIEILKELAKPKKKEKINFPAMLHSDNNIVSIELIEEENTKKAKLIFKHPNETVNFSKCITKMLYQKAKSDKTNFGACFEEPSQSQFNIKPGFVYLTLKKGCGLNSSEDVMAKLKEIWPTEKPYRNTDSKTYKEFLELIEDVEYEGMTAKLNIKGATEENFSQIYSKFNMSLYHQYNCKKEKFTQFFDTPYQTPRQPVLKLKSRELLNKDKLISALKEIGNSKWDVDSRKRRAEPSKMDKNVPAPKRRHLEQHEDDESRLNTMLSIRLPLPTINSGITNSPMLAGEPGLTLTALPVLPQFEQSKAGLNAIQALVQDPAQAAPATGLNKMKVGFIC